VIAVVSDLACVSLPAADFSNKGTPSVNDSFKGQVALVTGAAVGMGFATAKAFRGGGRGGSHRDWNGARRESQQQLL